MKLLIEASIVGIATVIIGTIISFVTSKSCLAAGIPKIHDTNWNKNHIMEISLFLTGFILHLLCEYSGINRWYCKNGNACRR
jgi:hypothetical protein